MRRERPSTFSSRSSTGVSSTNELDPAYYWRLKMRATTALASMLLRSGKREALEAVLLAIGMELMPSLRRKFPDLL